MDGTVSRDIHHSGGKVLLSSARNRQTSANCHYLDCCFLKWLQTTQLLLVFPPPELRDGRKERREGAAPSSRPPDRRVIRVESLIARLRQGYQVSLGETSFSRRQLSPVRGGNVISAPPCPEGKSGVIRLGEGEGRATRARLEGTRTLALRF